MFQTVLSCFLCYKKLFESGWDFCIQSKYVSLCMVFHKSILVEVPVLIWRRELILYSCVRVVSSIVDFYFFLLKWVKFGKACCGYFCSIAIAIFCQYLADFKFYVNVWCFGVFVGYHVEHKFGYWVNLMVFLEYTYRNPAEQRILCVGFCRMGSGLCIYHLFG